MKNTLFFLHFLILCMDIVYAQPPASYYDSTVGKSGYALKKALFQIIKDPKVKSDKQLWTSFKLTDMKGDTIWDMYSLPPLQGKVNPYYYKYDSIQCGDARTEGDCYNREHSFPASWFGATKKKQPKPMYTDLFHIYPTDGKVNNTRDNYPFGIADPKKRTWPSSQNGSKKGFMRVASEGGDLVVFEPIDEFKGDFARTYFYMATCYEDKIAGWNTNDLYAAQVLAGNDSSVYKQWYVDLLLQWHEDDSVSKKEILRNNAVYLIQKNRNPYIDSVQFVTRIWGK
ncbi:MAG: endonuclease [Bacteroidota bacterium]